MPKYVVRYGAMRALGVCATRGGKIFGRGTRVITRTERGLEAGEILCEASEQAVKNLQDPRQGQVLRAMTTGDENELAHMQQQERREFETCRKAIEDLKVDMKLVDIEHVFGGERVVIYYLAEARVDFRELVRRLADDFQTRIEMRQIGIRDEAKLLADYGDCGKPVCCNTHLVQMPPVSMKMAKLQKSTLDPNKISGRCGRLKCCLRYEYDTYEDLQKDMPPIGSDVVTTQGRAMILAQEILAGQLLIKTEDHRRVMIPAEEVLTIIKRGTGELAPRRGRRRDDSKDTDSKDTAAKDEQTKDKQATDTQTKAAEPAEVPAPTAESTPQQTPSDTPKDNPKAATDTPEQSPEST
jgi:cell fate regulator YaaT (PSP1 superfamily)